MLADHASFGVQAASSIGALSFLRGVSLGGGPRGLLEP
jgi:hypothetical protein